jgi:hypothetical protein
MSPATRATCCPQRPAADALGHCKAHLPRTLVEERHAVAMPVRCPHCDAGPPGWQLGLDCCHCFYCGTLWERQITVAGA